MNYYWVIAGVVAVLFFLGLGLYLYEKGKTPILALFYNVESVQGGALVIVSATPVSSLQTGDTISVTVEDSNAVGAQATAIQTTFGSGFSGTVQSIDSTQTNITLKETPSSLSSAGPINISVLGYFRSGLF